jgi:hypothetical protein
MLITGKKRPFRFVLKQEKPLNRGKKGMFHIKTLHERVGEASPWFALRCSPPPRLRGHPLTPPILFQKCIFQQNGS